MLTLPAKIPEDKADIQEFMAAVEEVLTAIVETGEFQRNYTEPDVQVETLLQEIFTEEVKGDEATGVRDSQPEGDKTESTALPSVKTEVTVADTKLQGVPACPSPPVQNRSSLLNFNQHILLRYS